MWKNAHDLEIVATKLPSRGKGQRVGNGFKDGIEDTDSGLIQPLVRLNRLQPRNEAVMLRTKQKLLQVQYVLVQNSADAA